MNNQKGFSSTPILISIIILLGFGLGYTLISQKNENIKNGSSKKIVNTPTSADYKINSLAGITITNTTKNTMRLERSENKVQLIQEYRPKGQIHDFPVLTITRWDSNE